MREIKFRGIEIDTDDFVYGYLTYYEQEDTYYIGIVELETPVKADTIGQYTGLNDKHGTEIYEGDVIKIHWKPTGYTQGIVAWNNERCCWHLVHKNGTAAGTLPVKNWRNTKIIGNIFENPELL